MPAGAGADTLSGPPPGVPRLVVGLGNPGSEYEGSRHNVGFAALDRYARRLGARPGSLKADGRRYGDLYRSPDGRFGLLWPGTYMNLSGGAVLAAVRQLETLPAAIFVISDDFHLPLGALRARAGGTAGGHNGLKSVEQALGTQDYPRLRIGVGAPLGETVDYVLSRFRRHELETVEETLETASWAAEDWALGASMERIQARYNRRSPQAEPGSEDPG